MNNETCPCCLNHCQKDNLSCGRGREHFNSQNNNSEPKTIEEQVIMGLRKCGHLLHHNKELDTNELLSNFTEEEELGKLHELISKIKSNVQ